MKDYFRGETADRLFKELVEERNTLQHAQHVENVENALDVPERNVGKWLPYEFGDYHWHKCSVCGKADKYIDTVIRGNGAEHDLTAVRNFCPNCGAKMEG